MNYINEQTKVPFYMTSALQKLYQMEMEYEKDMERMKALYPVQVRQLMPVIEDYCDGLEYEGSRIYDENPDAMMMRREYEKLIRKINKENPGESEDATEDEKEAQESTREDSDGDMITAAQAKSRRTAFHFNLPEGWELPSQTVDRISESPGSISVSPAPIRPCDMSAQADPILTSEADMPQDGWRDCLAGVLFCNEIFRRRVRHRRCSRWW
ncbi:MAG: hypothetical protein LIO37_05090 [Clostridiales bacterium]|nr:hypothetical protein [Clostridiales bacterium]